MIKKKFIALSLGLAVLTSGCTLPLSAVESQWSYEWKPAPGEAIPVAAVCPLKYDKSWAYSVEIDDGPATTLTVSQPLLENFKFTDAPPGVAGGRVLPFVGGAAVFLARVGGNNAFLSWDQLEELKGKGWGIINHSYWHSGNHWEPKAALTPVQFRRELFWSQALFAALSPDKRAASHFVYPNGYVTYGEYLAEFNLQSASRVGGSSKNNLLEKDVKFSDLNRNNLDGIGKEETGAGALKGVPLDAPKAGTFVIDFTHGMDADAQSRNRARWNERLSHIEKKFGAKGDDSVWCAPTGEVVSYAQAARAAKVTIEKGRLKIALPDNFSGSSLTVKLSGVDEKSLLSAPPGGVLYRQGNSVWITTPVIGKSGVEAPSQHLKRVYQGAVKNVSFDKPIAIAGVRLKQAGAVAKDFALKIELATANGQTENIVPLDQSTLAQQWGFWQLFPVVPDRAAVLASEVRITGDPALKEMEIWVVEQ